MACFIRKLFISVFVLLTLPACATQTFVTQKELSKSEPTILLLHPNVTLTELTAGGVQTPKADWTEAAHEHVREALREEFEAAGVNMQLAEDFEKARLSNPKEIQLAKLHAVIGSSIIAYQINPVSRLPTKTEFDWALGPEVSFYRDQYDSDYALFIEIQDSYSSGGRKAAIFMAALLFGVALPGGVQSAYATLVDLDTGEVVWFNFLQRSEGDLRELEPARETVRKLLTGFPA